MALYDYKCKCGCTIELIRKHDDTTSEKCPKCNGELKRQLTTKISNHFKGNGWHCKDYSSIKRRDK